MVVSTRVARTLALTTALAALALVVAMAGSAAAATKHGITPLAPKAGTSVPAGKSPVFRMKAKGPGQVWVYVCKSKHRNSEGVICSKTSIGRAKKKNGVFEYKVKFFDYPGFWLNQPGRYYWQAHRIDCNGSDCLQEGPVVKFRVK
jgi:hypothetical protein